MKNSAGRGGCYPPKALKFLNLLAAIFLLNKNNTISSPDFFGQRFNNLQRAALLTSLVQ